jgi:hypothetical protein
MPSTEEWSGVMDSVSHLRAAIIGLLRFAATEEEILLAEAGSSTEETGGPDLWAAAPLVAHNAEFKAQQAQRLRAVRASVTPPSFAEIDHGSAEVYAGYRAQPHDLVAKASRTATDELVDDLGAVADADLTDSSRHPWLTGRQLWLQVVVRGFWHPTGHVGGYYFDHSQPQRALALHEHAVRTVDYFAAPAAVRGMANYSFGCAQARTGEVDQAVETLSLAVRLNNDLRANVDRDPDLAQLRSAVRLDHLRREG